MITQTRIILNKRLEKKPEFRGLGMLALVMVAASLVLSGCAVSPVVPGIEPPPVVVIQPIVKQPPRIGLALGGGAARGFAHVGVIQVLEEAGIKVDLVAGTSAGSLVAAIYASGKNGTQLQQVSEAMEEAMLTDWTLPLFNRGMLRGEAMARYVNTQVAGRFIEAMPLPLGIVATDLNSGEAILFRRGDTGSAVRASSAVPSVFQPVKISGHEYVDGGLVSPVPVRSARAMGAELVIAVDISSAPEGNPAGDTLQVLLQTFAIMGKSINTFELRDADVVVRPSLTGIGSADFGSRRRSIEAGRQAMLARLPQLRAAIEAKSK
ncbi:MAG TPA: patatin-like phospholipase family protein [Burkholderiaceae bacterium]|nr:patatin-like phospholipase family protein [Burkholderiaceae bacterium]